MTYFWFIAGFMAGVAAAFFLVQLWRRGLSGQESPVNHHRGRVIAIAIGCFLLVSGFIYFQIGRPELIDQKASAPAQLTNHAEAASATGGTTGSMLEAAEKLAKRLAAGGGTDADWQLLQQSYAFLGDTEAADLAQKHQLKATGESSLKAPAAANESVPRAAAEQAALASYQQMVARKPADAASWLAIAQLQRTARNYAESGAAFEKVINLKAMSADAWADYADVSASLAKTLTNPKTRTALDAALKLDPKHSKALWLKASLAHEEHRYAEALKLWQQLRKVIPDSSPDVSIIDANIKEAESLVGTVVPESKGQIQAQAQAQARVKVSGSVSLDPAYRNNVTSDMTLFIYAKAPDSPAPVAAYRTTVKSWPVKFVLDDSQAMMPTRKLSQFGTVTISARLSRSGQAMAQSGDLQTDTVSASTTSSQPVELKINRQVP
jgi:cytochrome c-type biogenesis protein CcmH